MSDPISKIRKRRSLLNEDETSQIIPVIVSTLG